MFDGYLAVVPRCPACGEPLGDYRAADGPAFFTISIVGCCWCRSSASASSSSAPSR
jgi:uncharacterized protein (DUF983 family)